MVELEEKFSPKPTENFAFQYFRNLGLIKDPENTICRNCKLADLKLVKDNSRLDGHRYLCKSCGSYQALREDSIFKRVKAPFADIYCVLVYGFIAEKSINYISLRYEISKYVVSSLYKYFKLVIYMYMEELYKGISLGRTFTKRVN